MQRHTIRHCRACGSAVEYRVPDDGDTRERAVCPACGTIHYVNPLLVVGTVPFWGDRVLLCRRAIEPRRGLWTLPAGFMELDESMGAGALRETREEAGAQASLGPLFAAWSVPHVGQVHVFYLAPLLSEQLAPGPESLEARLLTEAQIPWEQIAFNTVRQTLKRFFEDRRAGRLGQQVHEASLS